MGNPDQDYADTDLRNIQFSHQWPLPEPVILAGDQTVHGHKRFVDDFTNGTWTDMQAVIPYDGEDWYATDQGVTYRGVNGAWVRTTGDPKDIWVTDYGWKCDNQTASASANVVAYNLAYAAAVSSTPPSQYQGHRNLVIPEAPGFTTAYVDDELNFVGVHVKGYGGTQLNQRVRVSHVGAAQGAKTIFKCESLAGGLLSDLYLTSYNQAVRIKNAANVHCNNVWMTKAKTGLAKNQSLVLENSFWLFFDNCPIDGYDENPTTTYAIGMYASDGGPISGVAETIFRNTVMTYGSLYFENQLTAPGSAASFVTFDNCSTESAKNQPFLTVRNTGTAAQGLDTWSFINCARFDTLPSIGESFFDFNGGNFIAFTNWNIVGQAASTYLIKTLNQISLGGWRIDSMASGQLLFDPTSSVTNVYPMTFGDLFGQGHAVRSNMAVSPNASQWGIGVTDVGYRVGHAIGEAYARGLWRTFDGQMSWGTGAAVHDTFLGRGGVGFVYAPMLVKAGVPADGDYVTAPPNGTLAINTLIPQIYCRVAGVWTAV